MGKSTFEVCMYRITSASYEDWNQELNALNGISYITGTPNTGHNIYYNRNCELTGQRLIVSPDESLMISNIINNKVAGFQQGVKC